MKMNKYKQGAIVGLTFWLGLLVVYALYRPGVSGAFIFDDRYNLSLLGAGNGAWGWDNFLRYVLSGFAGPTGRPVALLSFLLDAQNWPAPPLPFKYTNILIHLLNGCLLFAVSLSILRFRENSLTLTAAAKWTALFAALMWLCHPYLVSTTLYVVQRMAQLATMFVLAALWAWLYGRSLIHDSPVKAYLWMTGGMGFFGLLGLFSKENAAVLPVLVLVLEVLVVSRSSLAKPLNVWWKYCFLVLPTLAIIGYLLYLGFANGWFVDYPRRAFSPYERLLTESRVVLDYLQGWFLPRASTKGLYQDDLVVSRGLLAPVSTLVSLVLLSGLALGGYLGRKRFPLLGFAIFFFLASLLIESTTVGLELVFEHRAYMGSCFLFLPLLYGAFSRFSFFRVFAVVSLALLMLGGFTWQRAQLWGSYPSLVAVWAQKSPLSARAQIELGSMLYERGTVLQAEDYINKAAERIPNDFTLGLTQVLLQCRYGGVVDSDRQRVLDLSRTVLYRDTWIDMMQHALEWTASETCSGLSSKFVMQLASNFLKQTGRYPEISLPYSQLNYIKGIAALQAGRVDFMPPLEASLSSRSSPQTLMSSAAYLATYGYYDDAERFAVKTKEKVLSGALKGRELAEAPLISDIDKFIFAVRTDIEHEKSQHSDSGQK